MSSRSRATSSLRRKPPAKPSSSTARSRAPAAVTGEVVANNRIKSAVLNAAFCAGATPCLRRIPIMASRTSSASAGEGNPARRCTSAMEESRRRIVEGLIPASASWAMYSAAASGVVGSQDPA